MSEKCTCCHILRHFRESMTSVSAVCIILTPTQPVRSGRTERGSNPWPLEQECALYPLSYRTPLSWAVNVIRLNSYMYHNNYLLLCSNFDPSRFQIDSLLTCRASCPHSSTSFFPAVRKCKGSATALR